MLTTVKSLLPMLSRSLIAAAMGDFVTGVEHKRDSAAHEPFRIGIELTHDGVRIWDLFDTDSYLHGFFPSSMYAPDHRRADSLYVCFSRLNDKRLRMLPHLSSQHLLSSLVKAMA